MFSIFSFLCSVMSTIPCPFVVFHYIVCSHNYVFWSNMAHWFLRSRSKCKKLTDDSDCCSKAKWSIFSYIHLMMSALFCNNTLSWIFIELVHENISPQVDMSRHSDPLSRFWANQSLLIPLNVACFAEKESNIRVFGLTRPIYKLWSNELDARTLTITPSE